MRQIDAIKLGIKLFKNFRGHAPKKILIAPPMKTKVATRLGKLICVIYESDRGKRGKKNWYYHFTKKPHPNLDADVKTHRLFTTGGKIRVTRFGLVG